MKKFDEELWEFFSFPLYTKKQNLSKFNPYHDELGRFTSGPAGKRISARPKMTRRQLGLKGKVRSIIRYSSEERKEAVEKLALEGSDKLLMPRSENGFAQVMPKDMADKRYGSTVAEIQKSIKKLGVKSVVVTKSFAGKDDEEKAMAVRQMQATAQALEEAKAMGVSNKKLEILFTTRLTTADGLYDGWSGGNERDGKITIDLLSTSRVKAIAKKVQADDAPRVINAPTVAETTYASDYLFIESEEDFIGKYAYSVAIHEIGHHYTYKDAETPNVRRKFSLPTPSKYGRTDKYEMLAESFSAWWLLGGSKGKVGTFYKRWLPFVQVVLNANDNRGIGVPEALLKSMAKVETVLDVLKLSPTSPLIVYLSDGASLPDDIEKFNPYHDELGRFTSGSGNSKKVGPGGLLFHITDKKNRKSIEQNGFKGTAENPLFMAEQPHPFSTEDADVYVIDTSGVKLFPDTKRLIDRSRKSYFSETPIPLGKFRRLIGEELKVVYETHNSFKWNPDVISKFNPYHDELGRFTFASGGSRKTQTPSQNRLFGDNASLDADAMQHTGYLAMQKPTADLEVAKKTGAPIEWLMPQSMHPKLSELYTKLVLWYTSNIVLSDTDTRFNGLVFQLEKLGFNKYEAQVAFEGLKVRAKTQGKIRRENLYEGQKPTNGDSPNSTILSHGVLDFDEMEMMADSLAFGSRSDDHIVTINVEEDALMSVFTPKDGRYKTQFETKSSGGFLNNKQRAAQEVASFSLHPSLEPSKRPVYGSVHNDGFNIVIDERSNMYGRISLVLDMKSVNERTTWNEGDSLNTVSTHSSFLEASYHGLSVFTGSSDSYQDDGYIEAQIHGGVKKQNIKYIVLPVEYRDFADPDFGGLSMEDRLEQIGVKSSMIIYADDAESKDLSKSLRLGAGSIPSSAKLVAYNKSAELYSTGIYEVEGFQIHSGYVKYNNGNVFKVNVDDIYSRGYWNVLL